MHDCHGLLASTALTASSSSVAGHVEPLLQASGLLEIRKHAALLEWREPVGRILDALGTQRRDTWRDVKILERLAW